jgi:hypothetical protein
MIDFKSNFYKRTVWRIYKKEYKNFALSANYSRIADSFIKLLNTFSAFHFLRIYTSWI